MTLANTMPSRYPDRPHTTPENAGSENSGPSGVGAAALDALVRLIARQAAREFQNGSQAGAPPKGGPTRTDPNGDKGEPS